MPKRKKRKDRESATGRRPLLVVLRDPTARERQGAIAALLLLGALTATDLIRDSGLIGVYVTAPFLAAMLGGLWSTALVVPLALVSGVGTGVATSSFDDPDYWIRFGLLTAGCGLALFGGWANDRARANSRRLNLLNAIGEIATGALPLDETLMRITDVITPGAADFCMIDVIHEGHVTRAAARAAGGPEAAAVEDELRIRTPSPPEWLVKDVPQWRHIPRFLPKMRLEDLRRLAHDEDDLRFLRGLSPRSTITTPLKARGKPIGALTLGTAWSRREYTQDDVRFAQTLSGRVALALDNAGLFSDLESVERRMDAVMSMLAEAVTVHDARGRMVFANDAAARWFGFETREALIDATRGGDGADLAPSIRLFTDEGRAIAADSLLRGGLRETNLPWRGQIRAVVAPTREERWAVVSAEPIRGPDGRVLYTVMTLDDVTEVKRAEEGQRLLARTGELLASTADYAGTVEQAANLGVPQFATWASVNIPHDDVIEQVAVAHADPERAELAQALGDQLRVALDDDGGLARVIREGRPVAAESASAILTGADEGDLLSRLGDGSAIAVPMAAGGSVIGALVFVNDAAARRFDSQDMELARELGRRAGLAIENARLATEQAELSETLQRGLAPPALPKIPGWEAAAMYQPAGELNQVGGDFYDTFEFEGGWMIVLGDVVGRGAAAASITAQARFTLRTAGALTGDPLTALRILDESLRVHGEAALCSVVVVVLPSGESGEITVVSAGHPPPLVVREDGVEPLELEGPLLAAVDDPAWRPRQVLLDGGEQLLLYTDGIIEARGEHDRFGEQRLRDRLRPTGDVRVAIAELETTLLEFIAGPPQDDAAAVIIQRAEPAEVLAPLSAAAGRAEA